MGIWGTPRTVVCPFQLSRAQGETADQMEVQKMYQFIEKRRNDTFFCMFRLRSKVRAYTKQLLIGAGWPSDNGMWHAGLRCEKNSSWSSENEFPSMCVFFLWCQVGIMSFVVYFLMEKLRWGTCTSSTLSMLTWSQIISWLAKTTTLSGDLAVKSKS